MRKRQTIRVPHGVLIPEGVEDVIHSRRLRPFNDEDELDPTEQGGDEVEDTGPPVPDNFTIVEQILRRDTKNKVLVDVIFETDYPGYEVEYRISEA